MPWTNLAIYVEVESITPLQTRGDKKLFTVFTSYLWYCLAINLQPKVIQSDKSIPGKLIIAIKCSIPVLCKTGTRMETLLIGFQQIVGREYGD